MHIHTNAAALLLVVATLLASTPVFAASGPVGDRHWGNNVCQAKLSTGRVGGWNRPGDNWQRTLMLISGGACADASVRLYYVNRFGSPTYSTRYMSSPHHFNDPVNTWAISEDWWFGGSVTRVRGCLLKKAGEPWDCRDLYA